MVTLSRAANVTYKEGNTADSKASLRVIFGIIAFLALLGNGLVCTVILKTRCMLKNSYNLMILALSLTDMLTGVVLIVTPAFVVGDQNFPVPEDLAGELFCRLISSQFFLFTFGKISVAIVMLLALDRWYAISRPAKYKTIFKRRRVIVYLAGLCASCCVLNWQALFEKNLTRDGSTPACAWIELIKNRLTSQIFTVLYITFTFFVPLFVSLVTFLHLWKIAHKPRCHFFPGNRINSFNTLLRMCAITALFLAICWIPNQLVYMLSKFNITELDTAVHHGSVVLSMFSSCINPWIYGVTNHNYRRKFARVICFWKRIQVVADDADISANNRGAKVWPAKGRTVWT